MLQNPVQLSRDIIKIDARELSQEFGYDGIGVPITTMGHAHLNNDMSTLREQLGRQAQLGRQ